MRIYRLLIIVILLTLAGTTRAQTPFSRGVNLTEWLTAGSARQIQFTRFTKQDFVNIKSLGCDVIRLPINLHYMTDGSPNYVIDPLFYEFLDQAVSWAEDLHLYLILDNHTFDPNVDTSPTIGTVLVKVWGQMAQHYKDRSNYILFEVLNEPHGISAQLWGQAQQSAIQAIRAVDTKHTIVVGGVNYNSYNELNNIPSYTDNNLLYTFHFYDPFMFTHQGASWTSPSMVPLAGVPFPYDAATMPACPASLKGTWVESALNNYPNDGTVAKVKSLIDIAVSFKTSRNVNVYCGEFGVYMPNSDNTQRIGWYNVVHSYLEEKGIPWTTWDYQGGFGLFKNNSNELFNYDVNTDLVQNLGLIVPPQQVFTMTPETTGFRIYSDFIEQGFFEASGTSGILDFYDTNHPNNDKYCMYWNNALRYEFIGFDLKPNKDLSQLVAGNYALDFMARGLAPGTQFVLRFIDTKANASDHPWRMDYNITNQLTSDGAWHHVRVPLSNFTDAGSWDNSTWYPSQGLFDWKAVDVFNIVAENSALPNKDLWFDNINISNLDTATVRTNIVLGLDPGVHSLSSLSIFPNPTNQTATISYQLDQDDHVEISIFNTSGQEVIALISQRQSAGDQSLVWEGRDAGGNLLPGGIYLCRLKTSKIARTLKLIIIR